MKYDSIFCYLYRAKLSFICKEIFEISSSQTRTDIGRKQQSKWCIFITLIIKKKIQLHCY